MFALISLSKFFPALTFELNYYDPNSYEGDITIYNGKLTHKPKPLEDDDDQILSDEDNHPEIFE